ncbi:MAG: CvpA family protein [Halioglobus sp.]|nr:CvpA family protein [Halioglobus sp.]
MIDWSLLTAADWAIAAVISASVVLSLWRGFTREAVSLAGWVAAFVIANLYAVELSSLLADWIHNITGRYVAAFALLFVGTLIVAGVLSRLATQMVRVTGLSLFDRLLGTVFGFARGVILVLVAVYLLRQLAPPQNLLWLEQSQLMPHIDMLVQWVQLTFHKMGEDLGPGMHP